MIATPTESAVTKPVSEPTVVTTILLLLHVPPVVVSVSVVVSPLQRMVSPVIGLTATLQLMFGLYFAK